MLRKLIVAALDSLMIRKLIARPVTMIRRSKRMNELIDRYEIRQNPWKNSKLKNSSAFLEKYPVDFSAMLIDNIHLPIGLIADREDPIANNFRMSCDLLGLEYHIFDPRKSSFYRDIKHNECSIYLTRPSHATANMRQMYREKTEIIVHELGLPIYPTLREQSIYEAKRQLAYFLEVNEIPHPATRIFYDADEAHAFLQSCTFPQVFKLHNGTAASGVEILADRRSAQSRVKVLFNSYYIGKSISDYRDTEWGYILLQEFIPDAREYRVIKIGDSWFGHEKSKLDSQTFMSGSGVSKWTPPPHELLDFCHELAEKFDFSTMCFDIFEDKDGHYLVNELQTWFGSFDPSQMYLDGIPGRYVRDGHTWKFEPGFFNIYGSVTLRIVDALNRVYRKEKNRQARHVEEQLEHVQNRICNT